MQSMTDTFLPVYCPSESESQLSTQQMWGGGVLSACEIAGDFEAPRISRSSL